MRNGFVDGMCAAHLAEEDGLELKHAGDGEQHGGVFRNQGAGWQARVPLALIKRQKALTNFGTSLCGVLVGTSWVLPRGRTSAGGWMVVLVEASDVCVLAALVATRTAAQRGRHSVASWPGWDGRCNSWCGLRAWRTDVWLDVSPANAVQIFALQTGKASS